jgi:hypothetical protein
MAAAAEEELARRFAAAAARAQRARRRFDHLLLDGTASDTELAAAERALAEAAASRDRLAAELRAARRTGGGPHGDRPPPRQDLVAWQPGTGTSPGQLAVVEIKTGQGKTQALAQLAVYVQASQRELVGEVLTRLGVPLRGPDLSALVALHDGRRLTPAQLTQMRREERRRYDTGAHRPERLRAWYVVPCLHATTLTAATGTYSLSTWPLADRMITPYSSRLWPARAAAAVATELLSAGTEGILLGDPDQPAPIASGHVAVVQAGAERSIALLVRLLRGQGWGRQGAHLDLTRVVTDATAQVDTLDPPHQELVTEASVRLRETAGDAPDILLWGRKRPEAEDAVEDPA